MHKIYNAHIIYQGHKLENNTVVIKRVFQLGKLLRTIITGFLSPNKSIKAK